MRKILQYNSKDLYPSILGTNTKYENLSLKHITKEYFFKILNRLINQIGFFNDTAQCFTLVSKVHLITLLPI